MSEFREFLEEQLQDPEFRKEWDALEPEFAIVQALIDTRKSLSTQGDNPHPSPYLS